MVCYNIQKAKQKTYKRFHIAVRKISFSVKFYSIGTYNSSFNEVSHRVHVALKGLKISLSLTALLACSGAGSVFRVGVGLTSL